jgi:large subunit ribosomal protein L22
VADDPQTKQDRPSEGAAAPDEKVAQEAAEAKAAQAQEQAAQAAEPEQPAQEAEPEGEPETKPARKPRARQAKATGDEPAEPKRGARRRKPGSAGGAGGQATPAPTRRKQPAAAADGKVAVVRAQAKYVRASARKARLVCDHIRGKSVIEARAILAHAPRAVAQDWSKLLESAVANAENNHELVGDDLRIASVYADEGPTLKRFRPRAMGRATRIRKRTSHLTITLTPKE